MLESEFWALYRGGRTARNFLEDALFYEGTEKWQKNMNIALLSQGLLSTIVAKYVAQIFIIMHQVQSR